MEVRRHGEGKPMRKIIDQTHGSKVVGIEREKCGVCG